MASEHPQDHLSLNAIWERVEHAQPAESRWQRIGAILIGLQERGAKVRLHEIKCVESHSGVSANDYYLRLGKEQTQDFDLVEMERKLRELVSDWGDGKEPKVSHKTIRSMQSLPRDIAAVEDKLLTCTRRIINEEIMRQQLDLDTVSAEGSGGARRL